MLHVLSIVLLVVGSVSLLSPNWHNLSSDTAKKRWDIASCVVTMVSWAAGTALLLQWVDVSSFQTSIVLLATALLALFTHRFYESKSREVRTLGVIAAVMLVIAGFPLLLLSLGVSAGRTLGIVLLSVLGVGVLALVKFWGHGLFRKSFKRAAVLVTAAIVATGTYSMWDATTSSTPSTSTLAVASQQKRVLQPKPSTGPSKATLAAQAEVAKLKKQLTASNHKVSSLKSELSTKQSQLVAAQKRASKVTTVSTLVGNWPTVDGEFIPPVNETEGTPTTGQLRDLGVSQADPTQWPTATGAMATITTWVNTQPLFAEQLGEHLGGKAALMIATTGLDGMYVNGQWTAVGHAIQTEILAELQADTSGMGNLPSSGDIWTVMSNGEQQATTVMLTAPLPGEAKAQLAEFKVPGETLYVDEYGNLLYTCECPCMVTTPVAPAPASAQTPAPASPTPSGSSPAPTPISYVPTGPAPTLVSCVQNCTPQQCPSGYTQTSSGQCMPPTCPSGYTGTPPNCVKQPCLCDQPSVPVQTSNPGVNNGPTPGAPTTEPDNTGTAPDNNRPMGGTSACSPVAAGTEQTGCSGGSPAANPTGEGSNSGATDPSGTPSGSTTDPSGSTSVSGTPTTPPYDPGSGTTGTQNGGMPAMPGGSAATPVTASSSASVTSTPATAPAVTASSSVSAAPAVSSSANTSTPAPAVSSVPVHTVTVPAASSAPTTSSSAPVAPVSSASAASAPSGSAATTSSSTAVSASASTTPVAATPALTLAA